MLFALTPSLALSAGCATVYNPATERTESLFIGTAEEVSLGTDMDAQLRKQMQFSNDARLKARVESVGKRVAAHSDRQDVQYAFAVVENKELNAFAIPGGFVYVHSGLMEKANDNELAGVLAHEIGHVAARHSAKRLQAVLGYQLFMGVVSGKTGTQVNKALDVVFNLIDMGYSRQDELLADKLAVRYSRKAGYSPYGLVSFFKTLQKESAGKGSGFSIPFLSSHPPVEQRIQHAEEQIAILAQK